jgi:hypothetical protein
MPELSDPVSPKELRLGGLSFFFLAVGLIGAFLNDFALIIIHAVPRFASVDPVAIAMCFRVLFLLIAFVLGIFSRRTRFGRIGFFASGAVLAIGFVAVLLLFMRHSVRPAAPIRTTTVP